MNKRPFSDFTSLVNAILEEDDDSSKDIETLPASSNRNLSPTEELQKLEVSRKCKKCHQEDACIVFIPCGHLACCMRCSDQLERCLVC